MTGTAKLYCGLATLSLMAGCQQPTSYSASNIGPSSFIQGLMTASEPPSATAVPQQAPVAAQPYVASPVYAPIDVAQPVDGGAYVFEETAPPVVYTEQAALTVEPVQAAPVYLEASNPVQVDVQVAPAELYVEPAFTQPAYAEPAYVEPEYVAAPPIPAPEYVEQAAIVPQSVEYAAPVVETPRYVEEIAPPPVYEVESVPAQRNPVPDLPFRFASPPLPEGADGDLAVLSAPVLEPTEILESELAPLMKEVDIPTRPGFTPVPQPGLAGYGEAF